MLENERLSAAERWTLTAIAAASVVLRAVCYFRYRFDSDEPQHLHVAWGWTQGLVQYRDYFDNHAPLFHIVTSWILKPLGERDDILLWMRGPMLPLYAVVLWGTYVIARRFWSRRVAVASTVLLSFFPPFFLKSIEFRTDNAWNTVCVVALVVLTGGPMTLVRVFAAGLVLGIALCVSLKTMLLVISLAFAAVALPFLIREEKGRLRAGPYTGKSLVKALVFISGFAIAPAFIALYFVHLGAWPNLLYCVFKFNELVAATHSNVKLLQILYPLELILLLRYAAHFARRRTFDEASRARFYLGMLFGMYTITLGGFWILISPRDFLPMMPLLAIFVVAWLTRISTTSTRLATAYGVAALLCLAGLVHYTERFRDETTEWVTMMHQALRLAAPGEPLSDFKGETVYRHRPTYWVLETITREAMRHNLLPDTMWEDAVRVNCHVAQADGPFWPPHSRALFSANFLDMGRLRASGQWIKPDGTFTIAMPGEYVVIDKNGLAQGTLDGGPNAPRMLAAGPHRFAPPNDTHYAVLWAPAFARGFSPFHLKDLDF
ncbi:MAG TPA: hypothetical protein VHU41_10745 [Thermoanaerobaculia bacterium]|nr:hypothetical protein [Thermoanaerobaculia bacterium]